MDEKDRRKIQSHRCDIVDRISADIDGVIDMVYSKAIITDAMKAEIEVGQSAERKSRLLLDKLVKCGPLAYKLFRDVLTEKGFEDVVENMEQPSTGSASRRPGTVGCSNEKEKTYVVKEAASSDPDKEHGDVQTTLTTVLLKLDQMQTENKTVREEMEFRNEQMRQQMERDKEEMRKELHVSQEATKSLEKKFELSKTNYTKSLEEMQKELSHLTETKEENVHLKEQQKLLREQLNEKQERLKKLNLENVKLQKENDEYSALSGENQKLKTEINSLKQQIIEVNNEKTELELQLKTKNKQISCLESDFNDRIRTLEANYETSYALLQSEKDDLQKNNSETLAHINAQLSDIKKQVDLNAKQITKTNNFRGAFNSRTNLSKTYNSNYGYKKFNNK